MDNYGYGFLKAGAKAVFASGITERRLRRPGPVHGLGVDVDVEPVLDRLEQDRSTTSFSFNSSKIDGVKARMDPYAPSRYYRSVIGRLSTTIGDWRAGS